MRTKAKNKSSVLALQERLILHYSRIADRLETWPWYRDDNVARNVRSLLPPNPSRILELCCGSGLLLENLSTVFPRTEFVAVDISPRMVKRARERLSHRSNVLVLMQDWIYGFGSEWQNAFDVVIVKNALHVLDDLNTKLKDLRRVSHDQTLLIIVETVSPNLDANKFVKRLFQFVDPEHLKQTFFTEKTLRSALREACWFTTEWKPIYVKQHIDTEAWLTQKCVELAGLENARKLLSETRNVRVRQTLDFDTIPGTMPTRMLRLQYIARHVFFATAIKSESQKPELTQLQLL